MSLMLPKPPAGWNSFDSFGGYLHETAAFEQLEAFKAKLAPHGYEYFVVDIGWYGEYSLKTGSLFPDPTKYKHAPDLNLDAYGRPIPSKVYWPNGFSALIRKTHEYGLKFGLHLMRGIPRKAVELNLPILGSEATAADIANQGSTCPWCHYNFGIDMTKAGAQAYYDSLFALMAEWEVDFLKVDDITAFPDEVLAVADAIDKTGRPMALSLSPGGDTDPAAIQVYRRADMLRITKDIWDDVESIQRSFPAWEFWQSYTEPGFWPDLDMIPFGKLQTMSLEPNPEDLPEGLNPNLTGKGWARECELDLTARQTFITQRALSATPLMLGGDIGSLSEDDLSLITHPSMIACNQNGVSAKRIQMRGDLFVYRADHREELGKGWLGLFNRNPDGGTEKIQLSPSRIGLPPETKLYDVWAENDLGILRDAPLVTIPRNGCTFIEFS